MSLNILDEEHLLLLEILYHNGEMRLVDIDKFKYLPKTINKACLKSCNPINMLEWREFVTVHDEVASIDPFQPVVKITKVGKEYLRDDIRKRKQRFTCHSHLLEKALCAQLSGYKIGCTPFEKDVLIAHNCTTKDNKLTRIGEKYFIQNIIRLARCEWPHNIIWDTVTGPNEFTYTGEHKHTNWRELVQADFNLLHATRGVGVTLIPNIPAHKRKYPGILLSSDTVAEAISKIRLEQHSNPDHFIFCED